MLPFNTENWEKLEPQVRILWRVTGAVNAVVFGLIVGVPEFIITRKLKATWPLPPGVLGLVIFLIALVLSQWFIERAYQNNRFLLGDNDLSVSKGVFWKTWRFISRNRVQHVDITAGPIARALGIVQISIFVGGMAHAAATIHGLTEERAERLRHSLVKDDLPAPPVAEPVIQDPSGDGLIPPPGMIGNDQAIPGAGFAAEQRTEPPHE